MFTCLQQLSCLITHIWLTLGLLVTTVGCLQRRTNNYWPSMRFRNQGCQSSYAEVELGGHEKEGFIEAEQCYWASWACSTEDIHRQYTGMDVDNKIRPANDEEHCYCNMDCWRQEVTCQGFGFLFVFFLAICHHTGDLTQHSMPPPKERSYLCRNDDVKIWAKPMNSRGCQGINQISLHTANHSTPQIYNVLLLCLLLLLLDIYIDEWLIHDMLYFYGPHYIRYVCSYITDRDSNEYDERLQRYIVWVDFRENVCEFSWILPENLLIKAGDQRICAYQIMTPSDGNKIHFL